MEESEKEYQGALSPWAERIKENSTPTKLQPAAAQKLAEIRANQAEAEQKAAQAAGGLSPVRMVTHRTTPSQKAGRPSTEISRTTPAKKRKRRWQIWQ